MTSLRFVRARQVGLAAVVAGCLIVAAMPGSAGASTDSSALASSTSGTNAPTTESASPTAPPPISWQPQGVAPALSAASVNQGSVAGSTTLHLSVILSPRDPAAMAAMAQAIGTPGSPDYRHYLAPGQFGKEYGALPSTISAIDAALKSRGLQPGPAFGDGLDIPITTTAQVAESAFDVHLNQFRLPNGRVAFANTSAPELPEDPANSVLGVLGLDDLNPPIENGEAALESASSASLAQPLKAQPLKALPSLVGPSPCSAAQNGSATANQLAQAYGLTDLYNAGDLGAGESIALFEEAGYDASDISTYQACYGTSATVTSKPVDGGGSVGGGVDEVTGDIEIALGLAPKATILVYNGNGFGDYMDIWNKIVSDNLAPVVSTSWGTGCEPSDTLVSAENTVLMTAEMNGQTVFAATGDGGSEDCLQGNPMGFSGLAVQDPGSQPLLTGVGGTNLSSFTPPAGEVAWPDSTGGISINWPIPSWQSGPGVINGYSSGTPCGASSGDCREVPDVSALSGSPGYAFYCTAGTGAHTCNGGGWLHFFGTSGAAPLWAAFAALTDESCTAISRIGFINPLLYQLGAESKGAGPGFFNDITSGDNDMTGGQSGAYPATVGYDMVTGLGSPIGLPLAAALCGKTVVPVTITGASVFGGPVSFSAAVSSPPSGVTGVTATLADCKSTVTATDPPGTYNNTITRCQGLALTGPNANQYTISYVDGGVTVSKADTSTLVSSNANPSVFGQSVTFTATVSVKSPGMGTPSGTVKFFDNGTQIGQGTLNGLSPDTATFTTSSLSVGSHPITAKYNGDTDFNNSTSTPAHSVTQVVTKDSTTTVVSSNANPSVFGQPVTLTATVSANLPGSGTPTGSVQFFDGVTPLGPAGNLSAASPDTYSITVSSLSVATHMITADYAGDGNFLASDSAVLNQVVNKAMTTTSLAANPAGSVGFGHAVTFTATVGVVPPGAGSPTGPVVFSVDGTQVQSVNLNGSEQASVTTSALLPGSHTVTAAYQGDSDFLGSTGTLSNYEVTCTVTVTSPKPGALIASGDSTCVIGTTVNGSINVPAGTSLAVINSTVTGAISATNSPGAVTVCGSTTGGALDVVNAQGLVIVGDTGDANCAVNTVGGVLMLRNNTHGVEAIGNSVDSLINSGNSGPGPYPGDLTNISGNIIR